MRIGSETTTVYHAECDLCGAWGPMYLVEREAEMSALEAGWRVDERWNGLKNVQTTVCPRCEGRWSGEGGDEE